MIYAFICRTVATSLPSICNHFFTPYLCSGTRFYFFSTNSMIYAFLCRTVGILCFFYKKSITVWIKNNILYSLIYEGDTVIYDYVMYFSIILSSIKLVFLFLCSLHFFPPWNMWVLGLWVWFGGGQVKLYFFLFLLNIKLYM